MLSFSSVSLSYHQEKDVVMTAAPVMGVNYQPSQQRTKMNVLYSFFQHGALTLHQSSLLSCRGSVADFWSEDCRFDSLLAHLSVKVTAPHIAPARCSLAPLLTAEWVNGTVKHSGPQSEIDT